MKLPRDLSGADLVAALRRLGYRQTRSHVWMTLASPREAHLTVPQVRSLAPGTLAVLVKDAAVQLEMTVEDVLRAIR